MTIFIIKINYNEQQMLITHSPQKQNRSPEGKRRQKAAKEIRTAHELLQILAVNHIAVSQQLISQILQNQQPQVHNKEIKLFGQSKSEDEVHQLKIKLADYEFELKKIGEDFAEFQLLAKMEKDKSLRKLREQLENQRIKNIEDNTKWEKKFSERQKEYEKQCQAFRIETNEIYRKQHEQKLGKAQKNHDQMIHKLVRQHEEAIKNLQKTIEELKIDFEQRIRKQKERHTQEEQAIKKTHEILLHEKEQLFSTKIIAAQCEKKAEIKIIEETKKENIKTQEKYLHQIGIIERQKKKLEEKSGDYEIKYKVLLKKHEDRGKELEELKKNYTEELEKAEHDRSHAVQNARALVAQEKVQFLREEYARSEQLEHKVMKLHQMKEQMQYNYDALLRTLEVRFQRRESKREDVEAIREYEQQLIVKQRENSQIYQQLRMVQLEKENNDKIYTRIFTSNKKDKKSLSHKTDHDIHTLLKQSQTTDFRHLLKLSHK